MVGIGLGRKSDPMQDGIHELAGGVTCERPTCAVGSVRARSESKNHDAGMGVAESGHGTRPVFLIPVRPPLFASNLLPVSNQARALGTYDDLLVQNFERGGHCLHCKRNVLRARARGFADAHFRGRWCGGRRQTGFAEMSRTYGAGSLAARHPALSPLK